jgi:hypothetical protein
VKFAIAAVLILTSCKTRHDPEDLKSVFDRPVAVPVSASASAAASVRPPPKKAAPSASAAESVAAARRKPEAGPCVEMRGEPAPLDTKHSAKRPACRRAEVLEDRDPDGTPRYACVFVPDGVDKRAPVPLLVFFHGSDESPAKVSKETELRTLDDELELSGDPAHKGFVVLAPQARRLARGTRAPPHLPRAANGGPGAAATTFDSAFVSPDNADVKATDRFLSTLAARGWIDKRRVYAMGAGRGGEMAAMWTMLHPDRAVAYATYASDAHALRWTCPSEAPPAAVVYRACDALTPCIDVEQWLQARDAARAPTWALRLGSALHNEPACSLSEASCKRDKGIANHARWPKGKERDMLEFLGRFSLDLP